MEIRDILHAAQYDIGYSLLLPHGDGPHTCVLIVGGSLSHDRDGQIVKDGVGSGERFALKELAQKLLEEYEVIKKHISPPVARLTYGQCSGCNTSLPSATLSKIKNGALIECETCGRMIIQ